MSLPKIRCIVESMNYSACGHVPGDYFEVDADGIRIPEGPSGPGFCYFAVQAVTQLIGDHHIAGDAQEWVRSRPAVMCTDPPEALRMRIELAPSDQECAADAQT